MSELRANLYGRRISLISSGSCLGVNWGDRAQLIRIEEPSELTEHLRTLGDRLTRYTVGSSSRTRR
jgi:hypothetical protein